MGCINKRVPLFKLEQVPCTLNVMLLIYFILCGSHLTICIDCDHGWPQNMRDFCLHWRVICGENHLPATVTKVMQQA